MKSLVRLMTGLLLLVPVVAQAATLFVTTSLDEYGSNAAACSLREALRAAETNAAFGGCAAGSGNDVINLPNGRHALTRLGTDEDAGSVGDLDVNAGTVTLQGGVASTTLIDAGLVSDRVLHVGGSANVSVQAVTLTGGVLSEPFASNLSGGGAYVDAGATLKLLNAVVDGNRANLGGGIFNLGTLLATRSTLSNNVAGNTGGGLYHAGVSVTLTNVTVSGNIADVAGGIMASRATTINNSTIANNAGGGYGAGLRTAGSPAQSLAIKISNSLFADNRASDTIADDVFCSNPITTGGSNLIENTNGTGCTLVKDTIDTPRDLFDEDPHLAPLFDLGNGVLVHALMPDSAATAAANTGGANPCDTRDARFRPRPLPTACDIGAYESVVDYTVAIGTDAVDAAPGNGICGTIFPAVGDEILCSLRAAVQEANLAPGTQTIRIDTRVHELTIPGDSQSPAVGDLDVNDAELLIIGNGVGNSIIEGENGFSDRLLDLLGSVHSVALLGVQLRNAGDSTTDGGALRMLTGNLLMFESQIDHGTGEFGGGLYADTPIGEVHRVHIERSAIARNTATAQGGGAYINNAALVLVNSSVGENQAAQNGGGLKLNAGLSELNFTSISGNRVTGTVDIAASGGGVHLTQGAVGILRGSLIANNRVLGVDASAADCAAPGFNEAGFGGLSLQNYNWLGDGTGCAIEGDGSSVVDQDPLLSQLSDSQSATLVPAPQPGSPLLDAIPAEFCHDLSELPTQRDQADNVRPQGVGFNCDIGAFEGVSDLIFRDGFE